MQRGMKLNYQHHWCVLISNNNLINKMRILLKRIIDNMPVTFCFINQQNMNVCTTGFPMGCYVTKDGKPKDACVLDVCFLFLTSLSHFTFVNLGTLSPTRQLLPI